jgi:hypothetical protein
LALRTGEPVSYREIYDLLHGKGFAAGHGNEGYRANVRTSSNAFARNSVLSIPSSSTSETTPASATNGLVADRPPAMASVRTRRSRGGPCRPAVEPARCRRIYRGFRPGDLTPCFTALPPAIARYLGWGAYRASPTLTGDPADRPVGTPGIGAAALPGSRSDATLAISTDDGASTTKAQRRHFGSSFSSLLPSAYAQRFAVGRAAGRFRPGVPRNHRSRRRSPPPARPPRAGARPSRRSPCAGRRWRHDVCAT